MKKLLSLILSMAMLISTMSVVSLNVSAQSVADQVSVEFEEFDSSCSGASEAANGGGYIGMNGGALTEYTVETNASVAEEGYYEVVVYGVNDQLFNGASSMSLSVNGEEVSLAGDNVSLSGSASELFDFTAFSKVNKLFYLKAGTNTFDVTITPSSRQSDQTKIFFSLDCIKLERYELAEIGENGATVEVEDFDTRYSGASNGASGSGYIGMNGGGLASVTYESAVYAPEAGYYEVEVYGVNDQLLTGASAMSLSVNDGDAIAISGSNISEKKSASELFDFTAYSKLSNKVYLNEGINKFKVTVTPSAPQSDEPRLFFSLDCIKVYAPEKIGDSGSVEFADFYDKGAEYLWVQDASLSTSTRTIVANMKEEGYYEISLVASNGVVSPYLSPMTLAVNDTFSVSATGMTMTALAKPYEHAGFEVKEFAANQVVYLNKGENTFTVTMTARQDGGCYGVLDCINIEKYDLTVADEDGGVVEVEVFDQRYTGTSDVASGDGFIGMNGGGLSSVTLNSGVYAPEAGYYEVEVYGVNDQLLTGASAMSLSVNDGDAIAISGSNISEKKSASGLFDFTAYSKLSNKVYLKEGVNTFKVTVTPSETQSDKSRLFFSLDCIKVYAPEKIGNSGFIEFEDFAPSCSGAAEAANGGGYIGMNGGALIEYTVETNASVAEEGYYEVMVYGVNDQLLTGASSMSLSVNGEEVSLAGDNVSLSSLASGLFDFTAFSKVNKLFYLKAGTNTFDVTITPSSRQSDQTKISFSLDCIKLERYELAEIGENGATVEVEDFDTRHSGASDLASGNGFIGMNGGGLSSITFESALYASQAGYYKVEVDGANNATLASLSSMSLSINDGNAINLKDNTTVFSIDGNPTVIFDLKALVLNDEIYLNEGINKFKVTVTPSATQVDTTRLYFVLDCIKVYKERTLGVLTMDDLSVCTVGTEQNIAIYNDGEALTNADVYQITYQSDDEDVAEVDGTGKITATGMGKANISVAIYVSATTVSPYVLEKEIIVTGDAGLYITNEAVASNTVSFDVKAISASEKKIALVAVYEGQRCKEVKLVEVPAMNAGASSNGLNTTVDTYTSTDKVSIMLIDAMSNVKPLWVKTEI